MRYLQIFICLVMVYSRAECEEVSSGKIRIVCTAALLSKNYDMRKKEYIRCLKLLRSYGYKPYVFEACYTKRHSFLDDYTDRVFYSKVNDYRLANKGINEARSMIKGFKYYPFDENDMIVKLTGRYHLTSPDFLTLIEQHPDVDVFVKYGSRQTATFNHVFTGCFAMRYKFMKEMLDNLDFEKMEREMIDIECEVADFAIELANRGRTVMYVDHLGMEANIGGPNPPVISYW